MIRKSTCIPVALPLAISLLTGGCSTTAPRFDMQRSLEHLKTVSSADIGHRRLNELDISGNGVIDEPDWAALESVATAAGDELGKRSVSLDVHHGLYQGPKKDAPPIFASLQSQGSTFDVSSLDTEQLRELAIESRWMAQQARMASVAGGVADERIFGGTLATMVPGYSADSMSPAAVCKAIDELDVALLRKVGVTPVAIFDLDSTVWSGNVMDPFLAVLVEDAVPHEDANPKLREFLKTLAGADAAAIDAAGIKANIEMLLERWSNTDLPKEQRINAKDAFYNIVVAMRGMTPAQAQQSARKAFEKGAGKFPGWQSKLFTDGGTCGMRQLVERLRARGIEIYFLSATLDVLAIEGGRLLGVGEDRVLGSILAIEDGHYTGEVADSTYYSKGAITRQWLSAPPLLAFGDSPRSDFTMLLEAAGVGFMINPREILLKKDQEEANSRFVAVVFERTEGDVGDNR